MKKIVAIAFGCLMIGLSVDRSQADFALETARVMACLTIKLFAVVAIAQMLVRHWRMDRFAALVGAWLLSQVMQDLAILALSAGGLLTPALFIAASCALCAGLCWQARTLPPLPEIRSDRPVDSGFISEPLDSAGDRVFVRARFDGDIRSAGPHAGHLSVHALKSLIELPTGVYLPSRSIEAFAPPLGADGASRISFGLGGWGVGEGRLRLASLEVFRFSIHARNAATPAP